MIIHAHKTDVSQLFEIVSNKRISEESFALYKAIEPLYRSDREKYQGLTHEEEKSVLFLIRYLQEKSPSENEGDFTKLFKRLMNRGIPFLPATRKIEADFPVLYRASNEKMIKTTFLDVVLEATREVLER